jgi:hypothetical protein
MPKPQPQWTLQHTISTRNPTFIQGPNNVDVMGDTNEYERAPFVEWAGKA